MIGEREADRSIQKVKARALPWTRHAGGVLRTTGP